MTTAKITTITLLLLFLLGCGIKGRPLPPATSSPASHDQTDTNSK